MPSRAGKDSKGCYYQWGSSGKKYYYKCGDKAAGARAKAKADRQGAAAYASGYGKDMEFNDRLADKLSILKDLK